MESTTSKELADALQSFLDMYVGMVNSGDCGFWNPETDKEVIEARRVLGNLVVLGG